MDIYPKDLPHIPYFYIIQHNGTKMLYAGCRYSKQKTHYSINGCHPDELLKSNGYFTSSKEVLNLIKLDGVESFSIIQLIEENFAGIEIYEYETRFLQTYNIAERSNWLNKRNNDGLYGIKYNTKNYENNGSNFFSKLISKTQKESWKTPERKILNSNIMKNLWSSGEFDCSVAVKNYWAEQSQEYKNARTITGLSVMNSYHKCIHCGLITNKGNISRYHNDRCKQKIN